MSEEEYITSAEASKAWGLTSRRVRDFCACGRIEGAMLGPKGWLIPKATEKPIDGRTCRVTANKEPEENNLSKIGENKEMNERNLMNFCADIKVVDCTIRDGGLVNNFGFSDDFIRDLYKANIAAGVDYMEMGYRASKKLFDPKEFGKWKFASEEDIRAIVGDNNSALKLSIMADAGRCDYKEDIIEKKDSVVDMIRVACYIHQIPLAMEMIEDAKAKGYEVTCNLMAVSKVGGEDLDKGLAMLAESPADVIYVVDSFGNYYPEQINKLVKKYIDICGAKGKQIGFHGHNNQQLAFANTIEACRAGANYLDATVNGMGRGAGNCYSEMLLSFLKNPKYSEIPILDVVENHILKMKAAGQVWGYDVPYLLTGILNSHPSSAIKFIKDGRSDYTRFLSELEDLI